MSRFVCHVVYITFCKSHSVYHVFICHARYVIVYVLFICQVLWVTFCKNVTFLYVTQGMSYFLYVTLMYMTYFVSLYTAYATQGMSRFVCHDFECHTISRSVCHVFVGHVLYVTFLYVTDAFFIFASHACKSGLYVGYVTSFTTPSLWPVACQITPNSYPH